MANDDLRQAQTLDIPHGTTFEFKDGKLVFGHESDIVIRTNLGGHKFQKIFSKKGSVQVMPPTGVEFDVEEIEALGGDVFLNGRVRVRSIRAKTIHFQEGSLVADKLEASSEAVLAGERLEVVHVKAPRVSIEGDAQGTCLIIESGNDVGRLRTRGGFRSFEEARDAWERFQGATNASGTAPAPTRVGSTTLPASSPTSFATVALPASSNAPAYAPVAPPVSHPPRAVATSPASEPVESAETGQIPALRDRFNQTEEFRAPFGPSSDAGNDTSSALPKSSVFRKRK